MSAAESRERIALAGKAWHKVLGVSATAFIDDVKRIYRQLALLHHPDKPDGDADTFRTVQEAYVLGVRKCRKRPANLSEAEPAVESATGPIADPGAKAATEPAADAKAKAKSKGKPKAKGKAKAKSEAEAKHATNAGAEKENVRPAAGNGGTHKSKQARPKPWAVSTTAPPAKIRKAVDEWEGTDRYDEKTMPDNIPAVVAEEFAQWVRSAQCVPVDVRETNRHDLLEVQGAVHLSFSKMFFDTEEAAPVVARLKEDGRRLVLFSDKGGRFGTCGIVGALLLDAFGFEEELVHILEGGFEAWCQCLEAKQDLARAVEPLAMRLQRRKAAMAAKAQESTEAPVP